MVKNSRRSYVREIFTKYKTLKTEKFLASSPSEVWTFLKDRICDEPREHFVVLGVDNKNVVLSYHVVSIGTMTEAIVHPREVFLTLVEASCSSFIIAHNHPSGSLTPSRQDLETTKRLIEAGKILGIPMLDHIIVTESGYYSIKEQEGIL
jgi:DNA repair protein RadC